MIKKILLIKLREMGDTVLLTAPLYALHRTSPKAQIHVLVDSRWSSLLEGHPAITRLWTLDKKSPFLKRMSQTFTLIHRLRNESFDAVANFHASSSSALLARALNAPIRSIHFHGHQDENKFSTVTVPGKGQLKPIIERDMDTLRALGLDLPVGAMPFIPRPAATSRSKHLVVSLGASRPTKSWPLEKFAHLIQAWLSQPSQPAPQVTAVVGPHEKALLDSLQDLLKKQMGVSPRLQDITFTHSLSLSQLKDLLGRADVFVGNDSGPKHLAVALGTPTVTLFGPEDPFEWHPYPFEKHPYLFVPDLSCRIVRFPGTPPWCGVQTCLESHRCMREISFEQVLKEALRVARREP